MKTQNREWNHLSDGMRFLLLLCRYKGVVCIRERHQLPSAQALIRRRLAVDLLDGKPTHGVKIALILTIPGESLLNKCVPRHPVKLSTALKSWNEMSQWSLNERQFPKTTRMIETYLHRKTRKSATGLNPEVLKQFTPSQQKLAHQSGSPAEFARVVYTLVPHMISMTEADTAIKKYQQEWDQTK